MTQDTPGVQKVLLKVIHASQDEASITVRALCSLALDWLRKEIEQEETTIDILTEKVILCGIIKYIPINCIFHCISLRVLSIVI